MHSYFSIPQHTSETKPFIYPSMEGVPSMPVPTSLP